MSTEISSAIPVYTRKRTASQTFRPGTTKTDPIRRAVVRTSESELFANTFSRSFLKLRRVAVSYDFSHLIHSNSIKGLEVTLYGNNLAVLKKTPYLDPDFGASDSDLQDPSARYIGVSANITF